MRRTVLIIFLLPPLMLLSVGIIVGQTDETPAPSFELVQTLGLPLPRSILYDPNFERYAVVDAYGALNFVDANTYETQHVLYSGGDYTDFAFSHDGRWFVLTIGTRIELWDTQAYTVISQIDDLNEALSVHGPLTFSADDQFLLFSGTFPAPQSLRRSEFDTQEIAWIWNLTSARNEGNSNFPGGVEAYPFFDYRNGFVLGPENRIVAALPGRLHILDAVSLDVLFEIETLRYEPDPLTVLFSARDNNIYVRPVNQSALLQVDTQRGLLVEIPLRQRITQADLELIGGIELGTSAQVIGQAASRDYIPLLGVFLGEDYRDDNRYADLPLTVTLIDLVVPPTGDGDRTQGLFFIFDEAADEGFFFLSRPSNAQQMTLHPDGKQLLIRRADETVELYDIASGEQSLQVTPALRGVSFYTWADKNRVLSFTEDGAQFISDFERFDTTSGVSLAQDLRYSRQFDRFFWSPEGQSLVTLSGSEWRLFDITTGDVVRREALPLQGSIVAMSTDGYRYLTDIGDTKPGRAVYDVATGDARSVTFRELIARPVADVYTSPDWEHFLVVYSYNEWGPYFPGNEVAMYGLDEGLMWFAAGDDLPYPDERTYGWVDDETIYISGSLLYFDQPHRVYDLEFAPSGLPACVADQDLSPENTEQQILAWEALTREMSSDELGALTNSLCAQAAAGDIGVDSLQPTPTSAYYTPTPIIIPGVPACLTIDNPSTADEMAAIWSEITTGMSADEMAQAEALLCEGIGPTPTPRPDVTYQPPATAAPAMETGAQTMFIDVDSAERATGSYLPPPEPGSPLQLLLNEFYRTMNRDPGLIALSPDEQLMAASSLPGELLIYRLLTPYQTLAAHATATAAAQLASAQLVGVLPSATATYYIVGTPRPTLTPTITPTSPPLPDQRSTLPESSQSETVCPVEQLYTLNNLPPGYDASGRILAIVGTQDNYWVIEPEDGRRYVDEAVPLCGSAYNCELSPDGTWLLVASSREIFIVHPDGSDRRVLFERDAVWPSNIYWGGVDWLISEQSLQIPGQPEGTRATYIVRDNITIDDDPPPWRPLVDINGETAEILDAAYDIGYVLVRTTFSTGLAPGYRYYVHNIVTGETTYFARLADYPPQELVYGWVRDAWGRRLLYLYPEDEDQLYVFDPADSTFRALDYRRYSGVPSNDARYRAFATDNRAQPIGVWDTQTGHLRTYCIPENGARLYDGEITWSPDGRYLALQTTLPKDESDPNVGQHTLILNVESGVVVDLTTGVGSILTWTED